MSELRLSLTDIRSTKPSDYILNRKYPNPKVALGRTPAHIGILKLDIISGPSYTEDIITWYSFPHNYEGYIPTVIGLFFGSQGDFTNGGILPFQIGAIGEIFMDADEKNINVKFQNFLGGALPETHLFIRYYVFAEEGRLDP